MSPGGDTRTNQNRLDGPPPLPSEAKKKKPNWAGGGEDDGVGAFGSDPMIQIAQASKQIEEGFMKLGAAAPQSQPQIAALTTAVRQIAANALIGQSGPPGMGGMQAPMPMPPGPPGPPAPQAGPPASPMG